MNLIRSGLIATVVAAILAGISSPTASAVSQSGLNDFVQIEDIAQITTTSETTEETSDDSPTRDEVINYRKTFTSRAKSDIAVARTLAPKDYPGYFKTADYAKWYAKQHIDHMYDWQDKNFKCLNTIWQAESSWRISAVGADGFYLGIPQLNRPAVVASGISVATYRSSVELQVQLGAKYIKYRYGSPCKALKHKKAKGWY